MYINNNTTIRRLFKWNDFCVFSSWTQWGDFPYTSANQQTDEGRAHTVLLGMINLTMYIWHVIQTSLSASRWVSTSYTCQQPTTCLRRSWSRYYYSRGKKAKVMSSIRRLSVWPRPWWSTSTASRARSGLPPRPTRSPRSSHQVWPDDDTFALHFPAWFICVYMHWTVSCFLKATRRLSHWGFVWLLRMHGWRIQTLRSEFSAT